MIFDNRFPKVLGPQGNWTKVYTMHPPLLRGGGCIRKSTKKGGKFELASTFQSLIDFVLDVVQKFQVQRLKAEK